jgi:AraC-like DNA-binding protein
LTHVDRLVPPELTGSVVPACSDVLAVLECRAVCDREMSFESISFLLPPSHQDAQWSTDGTRFDFSGDFARTVIPVNSRQCSRGYGCGPTKPYYVVFANRLHMTQLAEELFDTSRVEFAPAAYPAVDGLHDDLARFLAEGKKCSADGRVARESLSSLISVALLRSALPGRTCHMAAGRRHHGVAVARRRMARDFAEPLPIDELAAAASLSRSHFITVFREEIGLTPHEYLRYVRIAEAKRLLGTGKDVTATCYAVGFTSLSGFEEAFRGLVYMSPREYRAAAR